MRLELTMNSGRVIISRVYPATQRQSWEQEFLFRIATIQSLTLDTINPNDGKVIERIINPINIESARILEVN